MPATPPDQQECTYRMAVFARSRERAGGPKTRDGLVAVTRSAVKDENGSVLHADKQMVSAILDWMNNQIEVGGSGSEEWYDAHLALVV